MVEGRWEMGKSDYEYVETDPTHRYGRFKEVLGKGATKTVYRAFDELKGMEVAWNQTKLDDVFRSPEELERLYSEVHLLSTLNHNSIIRFYTSWIDVTKRTFNFITEMFTSGTLREYRRKYTRVNIRTVKKWAREILEGLVYLHQHDPPVIHRDLKCDNIFVNGHLGQVKIGDLGLAAILRTSTSAHSVIGTPEFMAPELYEEEYNELVDVYSFGMCVMEMLTSEYPYGECSNPAQIYKKVTSGKLPAAFYRIQDKEAQKFVGKCLESASKRLSAKELLLDPFLQSTRDEYPPPSGEPNFDGLASLGSAYDQSATGTDMRITGKMNPKDDTIILKVQIADTDGTVRNIYFPFDILSDTPIDVATEMVKELEIRDREPMEIAEVIEEEISALVPHWKREEQLHHHSVDYPDHDEEARHHLYPPPSPSSSHASFVGGIPPLGENYCGEASYQREWLQDDPLAVDDASSQSSLCYSNLNYNSGNEQELDLSPRGEHHCNRKNPKSTRFCPEDHLTAECSTPPKYYDQCSTRRTTARRCLARIRSFMDIRSQILHQSLVEEVTKRRLFKTVGAVENIGFQAPCDISRESVRHSRKGKRAV